VVVHQAVGDEEQTVLEPEGATGRDLLDQKVTGVLLGRQDGGIRPGRGTILGARRLPA
jgi:hypothetical protein